MKKFNAFLIEAQRSFAAKAAEKLNLKHLDLSVSAIFLLLSNIKIAAMLPV